MELRHLEHFVAVAEERSFTRAAGRIHLVQSALSVSVKALERELGAPLFDRTTHRVSLTDAGVALLPEARRTLAAAERARDAVDEVRGVVRGTLRIGMMQSLTVVDVASILARFHREHPGVDIRPRPALGGSAALADDVRRGELDLAFLSVPTEARAGLTVAVLASEPLVLVCAPGQLPGAAPSRPGEPVPIAGLAGASFVDFPAGWGTRTAVDRAFAAAGAARHVPVEVADVTTFVELVRAGLGLGIAPPSLLGDGAGLEVRTLVPTPVWEVAMVTPAGAQPSAATRAFLRIAELCLAELAGVPQDGAGR